MWRVYNLRHTTVFTTPLGQSERAYYLSYFIKCNSLGFKMIFMIALQRVT